MMNNFFYSFYYFFIMNMKEKNILAQKWYHSDYKDLCDRRKKIIDTHLELTKGDNNE